MIKNGYAFGIDDPSFSDAVDIALRNIGDIMDHWAIVRDTEKVQKERKGKKRICLILEICLMECLSQ
jgi:hypothetical protein